MEGKREQYKGSERIRKEGKDLQGRNIKESREAVWCLMGKKKIQIHRLKKKSNEKERKLE